MGNFANILWHKKRRIIFDHEGLDGIILNTKHVGPSPDDIIEVERDNVENEVESESDL